jgi:hypothetical protein
MVVFFLFFAAVTVSIWWSHVRIRPKDRLNHQCFAKRDSVRYDYHALETHPITQHREGVQKDIWISQNGGRRHLRILSRQSEVTFHEENHKVNAVEKLQNLECWLQDDPATSCCIPGYLPDIAKGSDMQLVRCFRASEGSYFYPSHSFITKKASMLFFRLPGHDLPQLVDESLAFFTGTASEIHFSACDIPPTFVAQHLHATFDSPRRSP